MDIRHAVVGDEARIILLMHELMEPPGRRPDDYTPERAMLGVRHAIVSADADVLLAEDGDELIGLATVYVAFPSIRHGLRCWLQDLVTTSSRRGEGVGKALLDAATDWAGARGCTHLMLDSGNARKDAHRFYLREGMLQPSLTFERLIR